MGRNKMLKGGSDDELSGMIETDDDSRMQLGLTAPRRAHAIVS